MRAQAAPATTPSPCAAVYVDLDPGPGTLPWNCIPAMTYDGHMGTDTVMRTFGEQAIGLPIFAALDGTVVFMHDGEPDMNTVWVPGTVANAVIIDHGFGRQCWYWHFNITKVDPATLPPQAIRSACVRHVRSGAAGHLGPWHCLAGGRRKLPQPATLASERHRRGELNR